MVFARKCIIVLVIFSMIGTIASACEYYEPNEEEKEETDFIEQGSSENQSLVSQNQNGLKLLII